MLGGRDGADAGEELRVTAGLINQRGGAERLKFPRCLAGRVAQHDDRRRGFATGGLLPKRAPEVAIGKITGQNDDIGVKLLQPVEEIVWKVTTGDRVVPRPLQNPLQSGEKNLPRIRD